MLQVFFQNSFTFSKPLKPSGTTYDSKYVVSIDQFVKNVQVNRNVLSKQWMWYISPVRYILISQTNIL